MRVLIADKLEGRVPGHLQDLGCQVDIDAKLKGDALTARLKELDPEVLVVRSTRVEAADVAAAPSLALVIRAGSGVNTIDLAAASERGVYVANCPGKNAAAVAELAVGLLIGLDRRIPDNVAALRAGRWDKKGFGGARGLRGRTLAVLGVGRIGAEVARVGQALGMQTVAWSRSLTDEKAAALGVRRAASPEEAVKGADAVSVHLAATPETRGRIGKSVFDAMPQGSLFVNTSRADVVDEAALLDAIAEKGLRAGLDVFAAEPAAKEGAFDDPIGKNEGVYGTHHIGASTAQAEEAVGEEVVRIVGSYAAGQPIPNCVNLARHTQATHVLVVRHADRVGVLASVLSVLREAGHNVEDMQNTIFDGSKAAVARIAIVGDPSRETLSRLAESDSVFSAVANPVDEAQA